MRTNEKKIFYWILAATGVVVLALFGCLFLFSRTETGDEIRETGNIAHLREDISLMLNTYDYLVTLAISAFGIITFLVGYQQKGKLKPSSTSWSFLTAAVILMLAAIMLCIFSKEFLFNMVTRNAVDLSLPALTYSRWMAYGCLISSLILIGFFSLEMVIEPKP